MTHGGDRRSGTMGQLSKDIIALAARPLGVTNADVQVLAGQDADWVSGRMTRLTEGGHMLSVKVGGQKIRWFTTAEARDAWVASLPPWAPAKAKQRAERARRGLDQRSSIAKCNAAAKRMQAQPKTIPGTVIHEPVAPVAKEVKIPAHVKVQRIAAPAAFGTAGRLHVPDEPVIGGFASMGIGRYLSEPLER